MGIHRVLGGFRRLSGNGGLCRFRVDRILGVFGVVRIFRTQRVGYAQELTGTDQLIVAPSGFVHLYLQVVGAIPPVDLFERPRNDSAVTHPKTEDTDAVCRRTVGFLVDHRSVDGPLQYGKADPDILLFQRSTLQRPRGSLVIEGLGHLRQEGSSQ